MADLLPNLAEDAGLIPRGWHEYTNYKVVHENSTLTLADEGLVVSDSVAFIETISHGQLVQVNVRGHVTTVNGAIITVNKWLDVQMDGQNREEVITSEYDYHAIVRLGDGSTQNLLRYDNCHGGVETIHRHQFDELGEEAQDKEQPVAVDRMPTLDYVIREADALARWLAERKAN